MSLQPEQDLEDCFSFFQDKSKLNQSRSKFYLFRRQVARDQPYKKGPRAAGDSGAVAVERAKCIFGCIKHTRTVKRSDFSIMFSASAKLTLYTSCSSELHYVI